MIGVISNPQEREVVEEFFQLFKTPWEFYNPSHRYDVLLVTDGSIPESEALLIVVYGTAKMGLDGCEETGEVNEGSDLIVEWNNARLPIYGKTITFSNSDQPILFCSKSGEPIGYETQKGGQRILRIGYNLFREILFLLSKGQPPQNSLIPTLDLHIAMLRNWIVGTGVRLVEIPPVPAGYDLIACLTHDVDFVSIRHHLFDHSMWGFLYRATVGSLSQVAKGKASLCKLLENLKAVSTLPLVFLGLRSDPWDQFDHYLEMEKGHGSTYFFIPFKNRAGEGFCEGREKYRAAKYDVGDVSNTIRKLLSHGCEAGAHGIDAWHSVECGKQELQRIKEETNSQDGVGIRIHWLCWDENTFKVLDKAGYSYDSSAGYNETVGFRAGTSQAFKPIGVSRLIEIPMHIQDVALFGSGRINASESSAEKLCDQIIDTVERHKGVLTILWHQRSLGPERLWGDSYERLIKKLQEKKAWFATASDVVDWFRLRRTAKFEIKSMGSGEIEVTFGPVVKPALPRLVLRSYTSERQSSIGNTPAPIPLNYNDIASGKESFQRLIF